jgi:hypothetical protein
MLDQGVWAEVKVMAKTCDYSWENALGVQATVYNMNARNWIAPSDCVRISNKEKTEMSSVTWPTSFS